MFDFGPTIIKIHSSLSRGKNIDRKNFLELASLPFNGIRKKKKKFSQLSRYPTKRPPSNARHIVLHPFATKKKKGGPQFSLITVRERLVDNADRAGQALVIRLRRNPAAFLVGDHRVGRHPPSAYARAKKEGNPIWSKWSANWRERAARRQKSARPAPLQHPSKLVRTWAATRYSCGVDRAVPRGRFLFSLSPRGNGEQARVWRTLEASLARNSLSRDGQRKGKRFGFLPREKSEGGGGGGYRCNGRGQGAKAKVGVQKFRAYYCVSFREIKMLYRWLLVINNSIDTLFFEHWFSCSFYRIYRKILRDEILWGY